MPRFGLRVIACDKTRLHTAAGVSVLACLLSTQALANPSGATVIQGQASLSTPAANQLLVTTQNGAGLNHSAINWQNFSIAAGESTHFKQPSNTSLIINRVLSNNPSAIFGTLSSNGRLVLVNQAGIAVGQGAVVDTAGFTASVLGMSDADAITGRLRFGTAALSQFSTGTLQVAGQLIARSGDVVLIAPSVEAAQSAVVEAPNGSVILAAGQQVEITGRGLEGITLQVQAPSDQAINLGTLTGDAVGIFAGTLKHSGDIDARGLSLQGGKIVLKAGGDAVVDGNATLRARKADQTGGQIQVTGQRVAVMGQASLDASGEQGGGRVMVGGDWQGKNPDVANAQQTYFGPDASIKVDATPSGDGGTAVVWSDGSTRAHGTISAKGGATGGAGGLIETSGKQTLDVRGIRVDARAADGSAGTWMLDPTNMNIVAGAEGDSGNETLFLPESSDPWLTGSLTTEIAGSSGSTVSTVTDGDINAQLESANVVITTQSAAGGNGDITMQTGATITNSSGAERTLWLWADGNITIEEGAVIQGSVGKRLNVIAQAAGALTHEGVIATYGGKVLLGGQGVTLGKVGCAYSLGCGIVNATTDRVPSDTQADSVAGGRVLIDAVSTDVSGGAFTMLAGAFIGTSNQDRLWDEDGAFKVPKTSGFTNFLGTAYAGDAAVAIGASDVSIDSSVDPATIRVNYAIVGTETTFGGGDVVFLPQLASSDNVGLGDAAGTFSLNNAELARIVMPGSNNCASGTLGCRLWLGAPVALYNSFDTALNGNVVDKISANIAATDADFTVSGLSSNVGRRVHLSTTGSITGSASAGHLTLDSGTGVGTVESPFSFVGNSLGLYARTSGGIYVNGTGSGDLRLANVQTSGGDASITASGNVYLVRPFASRSFDVAGDFSLTSTPGDIAGDIVLAGAGISYSLTGSVGSSFEVTAAATSDISATGAVALSAGSIKSLGGNINLKAGTSISIDLASTSSLSSGGGAITLNAGTTLTNAGTINSSGGNISINLGTGLTSDLGNLYAGDESSGGSVQITAGATGTTHNLNIDSILYANSVDVSASGYISLTGAIRTFGGDVNLKAGTTLTNSGTIDSYGGNISINLGTGLTSDLGSLYAVVYPQIDPIVSGDITVYALGTNHAVNWDWLEGKSVSVTASGDLTANPCEGSCPLSAQEAVLLRSTSGSVTVGDIYAGGAGDALILAAGTDVFPNGSLSAPNGRWLVYSATRPASLEYASLVDPSYGGSVYAFQQYGTTYGQPILGGGNGLIYAEPAVLSTPLIGSFDKTYDGSTLGASLASYVDGGALTGFFVSGFSTESRDTFSEVTSAGAVQYPSKDVGTYDLSISNSLVKALDGAGKPVYGYSLSASGISGTISPAGLSLALSAANKVYDGTSAATITGSLSGVIGSDDVSLSAVSGSFADKNVGTAKPVTFSGGQISGADSGNYVLSGGTDTLSADITPLTLSVSALTAANKVYDGTTIATLTGGTLAGVIGSDDVSLGTLLGSFADKNVGTAKPVTFSGGQISGADSGNYVLSGGTNTLSADITPLTLSVSTLTAANKVYDGTTIATLTGGTLAGVIGSDDVSLSALSVSFADKNVGTAKPIAFSGLSLSGTDSANYVLSGDASTSSADITPLTLSVSALTAANKVYDGTTIATLTGGTLSGVIQGDVVTLGTLSGSFADKNVGTAKPIAVSGLSLSGTDSANYALPATAPQVSADITQRPLSTWSGAGADNLWSNPANWDALPNLNNVAAVSIPSGAVIYDAAAGNTTLGSLSASALTVSGGSLQLASGLALQSFSQSGGLLAGQSLSVSNSFSQSAGSIEMASIDVTHTSGNLSFSGLNASGAVSLAAPTGSIAQSGPVTAQALSIQSASGAVLNNSGNRVSVFSASNSGSGPIELTSFGPLDLQNINNTSGNIRVVGTGGVTSSGAVVASSGSVSITANSPLTIGSGGVSASGNIDLIATNQTSAGNIVLDGPITSSSGTLTIDAAADLTQNSSVSAPQGSVRAGGTISFGANAVSDVRLSYQDSSQSTVSPPATSVGDVVLDPVALNEISSITIVVSYAQEFTAQTDSTPTTTPTTTQATQTSTQSEDSGSSADAAATGSQSTSESTAEGDKEKEGAQSVGLVIEVQICRR